MPQGTSSSTERLQWILIAFLAIILSAVTVSMIRLRSTVQELHGRAMLLEDKRERDNMIREKTSGVSPSVLTPTSTTPSAGVVTTTTPSAERPPNVINVPGTRALLTISGDWTLSGDTLPMTMTHTSGLRVRVSAESITGDDLQAWFAARGASYLSADERVTVGPNQFLFGNKLGVDETVVRPASDETPGTVRRLTFVRDGGSVIVFVATASALQSEILDVWGTVLHTLSFP